MADPICRTESGLVGGGKHGTVFRFLGVPYAAPPDGARRFALPEPPARWDGVREATAPGPNAPQIHRPFPQIDPVPLIGKGWRPGSDYLSLNVWTPDPSARGLPVMVFIHGGAWVIGDKDAPVHDGTAFARSGVVCVAINYRLGIEGFLPVPGIPTNLGLRDQIAGLRWVRDNITAFGGDPGNVTVFGESAGAMSIADLLTSPAARGLFRRAIIESGHGDMVRSVDVMQRLVVKLARMLRTTPDEAGFRSRTPEQCLKALDRVQNPLTRIDLRDAGGREPAYGLSRFLPVYGDDVIPEHPLAALAGGAGADVDLLIGTNREEMNLYWVPTGIKRRIPGWLAGFALGRSVPDARRILKAYGLGRRGTKPGTAFTDATNDLVFRLPARRYAGRHAGRTWFYEFGWRSPACGGQLGACHALELPFVFDTLACASGPDGLAGENPPQDLATRVHGLWVRFATQGSLPWPEYDADARMLCRLESGVVESDPPMPAESFG